MVIVKLIGGLGNQMFQYATARRLAEKNSTILKLDVNGFESYKLHKYSLHCFLIREYLATKAEVDLLSMSRKKRYWDASKISFRKMGENTTLKEKHFHFDPEVLRARDDLYLDGFWQTEKYFSDIRDVLCREFTIKYPQDALSSELSNRIRSMESVSIHIRRADYVENKVTNEFHGVCTLDYYKRCVELIVSKTVSPHFFVFSDDPQWAKENLTIGRGMTVVDHNDASRNFEDLRLMSQCKHNIIANSSFSWWGAWLNENSGKIVCAPKKWFRDDATDTRDVIPENWITV